MISTQGNIELQQRERNARNAGSMIGATSVPSKTKCVCCKEQRTTKTGYYTAKGFVCNFCGRK